jgi:excisionase family DNA binding protein
MRAQLEVFANKLHGATDMLRFTTSTAAAVRLRRHPELIRRWMREGRLRAIKVGRQWLVAERALVRFERDVPRQRIR